jgi:hypothetical protein
VTVGASRVACDGMQRGQSWCGMTRRTSRRGCDSPRPVRAVTSLASARNGPVGTRGFRLMAGRARRRRQTRVGIVAALAGLMSWRCGLLFLHVTTRTNRSLRGRVGGQRSVARSAILVAWIGRHAHRFGRMAGDAEGLRDEWRERMWLVTGLARDSSRVSARIDSGDFRVTACTRQGRRARIVAVWRVARDAGALLAVLDMDIGVARCTGGRGVRWGVRRVAARANRVGRHDRFRKSRLLPVATDARTLTAGDEVVGLMAAYTRSMIGWTRPDGLGVARRARVQRGRGRRVDLMAIAASLRATVLAVLESALFVAGCTCGGDDRR